MRHSSLLAIIPLLLLLATGEAARACLSRPCRAARRQQGREPAARGHAVVHPEAGAGLQQHHRDQRRRSSASIAEKPASAATRCRSRCVPGGTGTYHVNWHVLSVDTHTTDGNFTFQVGQ